MRRTGYNHGAMQARTPYHPATLDWARRVLANGGGVVPMWLLQAVDQHYRELVCRGVEPLMRACVMLLPGNLALASTPLFKRNGNDPWTNGNFVSSDLTVNGLKGNTTSKYLDTGFNPSTVYPNDNNAGITIYFSEATQAYYMDLRAEIGTNSFGLFQWGPNVHADIYCGASQTGRRIYGGTYTGYLSINRTASNSLRLARASSSFAHTIVSSGTTSGGSRVNATVQAYCYYNGSTRSYFTDKRMSYIALHDGLTDDQSKAFFESIQLLRKRIGGGWV